MVDSIGCWLKRGVFSLELSVAVVSMMYLTLSLWAPFKNFVISNTSAGTFTFYRLLSVAMALFSLVLLLFKDRIDRIVEGFADDLSTMVDSLKVEPVTRSYPEPVHNGMLPINVALYGVAAAIGLYALYLAFLRADLYLHLIREDGPVEYGSFLMWALAGLGGVLSLVLNRHQRKLGKIAYICMILFFIACGGEEISWGQRIFGFKGSDALLAINKQHELNIHDIGSISFFSNTFFLLTLIFFIGIPWLEHRYVNSRLVLTHFGIPSPSSHATRIYLIGLGVWIAVGVRFGTLGFHPFSLWDYYTQMDDEIFELCAAYSFFAFICLDLISHARRRHEQTTSTV